MARTLDQERPRGAPALPHLRMTSVALVAAGGFVGAAARQAVREALHSPASGIPWATVVVNLVGAFLLGILIEALVRAGDDTGRRRQWRLVVGTGVLGGFTTYSAFAVEADLLVRGGHVATAATYVAVTLLGGLAATLTGIWLGARGAGRRRIRLPVDPDTDRIGSED